MNDENNKKKISLSLRIFQRKKIRNRPNPPILKEEKSLFIIEIKYTETVYKWVKLIDIN